MNEPPVTRRRNVALACITERVVQSWREKSVCVWYAMHPQSALSVAATRLCSRTVGHRFASRDGDGKTVIGMRVSRHGVECNDSGVVMPPMAVGAHIKLISGRGCSPIRVRIISLCVEALEQLLLSMENTIGGGNGHSGVVSVERLQTGGIADLLGRCGRRTAGVCVALRSMEQLALVGASFSDIMPNNTSELHNLKVLHLSVAPPCSLLALRGTRNIRELNVRQTEITDFDIELLSQHLQLRQLVIDYCQRVTSLDPLRGHPSLCHISAMKCMRLLSARVLPTIKTLQFVNLSQTAVCGTELWLCLQRLTNVKELLIDNLLLPVSLETTNLRLEASAISWKGVRNTNYFWITTAARLHSLVLDCTDIWEKHLILLCSRLCYLQSLSIVRCLLLRTSLAFLMGMDYMQMVSVSRVSLSEDHAVASLVERGVTCHVLEP